MTDLTKEEREALVAEAVRRFPDSSITLSDYEIPLEKCSDLWLARRLAAALTALESLSPGAREGTVRPPEGFADACDAALRKSTTLVAAAAPPAPETRTYREGVEDAAQIARESAAHWRYANPDNEPWTPEQMKMRLTEADYLASRILSLITREDGHG